MLSEPQIQYQENFRANECTFPNSFIPFKKIVDLTGMDFDNITEMLAVRNGIIILKILEQL